MRQKFVCLLVWACLLAPAVALAQQTGSVSGVVLDQTGGVIQGATVRVAGDLLPAGRTVQSDVNGMYRFPLLQPGQYIVTVEKTGLGKTSRTVEVAIDRDTQLDLTIGITTSEALTVVATTPVVDVRSTEVNFNYKASEIEALPLQKNYSGLFQLIPGVADNNSFAPSGGASRQDNKYLIDGVDITNPGFGYLSTEVNGLDIAEFQVKRGAITAEFGRATGFVTNAVSRSGTNTFHGIGNVELRPRSFSADENTLNTAGEIVKIDNTISRHFESGSLGGPLVKDRLFFYGSAMWSQIDYSDQSNALGPLPDKTVKTPEFFGKLTGSPTPTMSINGGFRYRPSDCEFCGIGRTQAASTGQNTESDAKVATVTWNWFLSSRFIVDARYIHMEENATNLPLSDLGFKPTFNVNDLENMGQYSDPTGPFTVTRGVWNLRSEKVNYNRDEFRATFSNFFDLGTTNHELKTGFGFEQGSETLERKSNGWGLLTIVSSGSQVQANYYPEQPAQVSPGRTYSLFVQDNITLGSRLVVNAGVLVNRDEFSQEIQDQAKNTFLTFGFGDEIQPRLGVNYQLRKAAGDKAYANWGRYYAMDQKSSARSLAPSRLFTNDALFNRTTGAFISDIPRASTTGKTIDPGLKPTYTDEWLVGYSTPLRDQWGLDVFYINRESFDFIEDIPASLPATGPFHAAQLVGAERKYRSFTVELSRRLANNWSMSTSYSWSRLEGNFDLDYSSGAVFNTSSAIQDGPGEFVQDRYRNGPLAQDRPHVFKVFASYMPPMVPNLTLGGYLRAQSGATWAARGIDWDGGFRRYLEPAGSHRVESWTNLDLLAAYRIPVGGRTKISVEGRVLNLFGNLTTLNVDQQQYRDTRIRPAVSAFAVCGTDYACATDLFSAAQTTNQPNSRFGQGSEWAPPRRFLLSFRADF
jgi:Carboxypeptidase regulatory-like domain